MLKLKLHSSNSNFYTSETPFKNYSKSTHNAFVLSARTYFNTSVSLLALFQVKSIQDCFSIQCNPIEIPLSHANNFLVKMLNITEKVNLCFISTF